MSIFREAPDLVSMWSLLKAEIKLILTMQCDKNIKEKKYKRNLHTVLRTMEVGPSHAP